MGYKPSVLKQAKFDYSPLGKVFNKWLKEEDKKEGLLKRLRNIEGKNEEQLKAIVDQGRKQLDVIKNIKTDSKSLKTISFYWIKSRGKKKQTKTVRCAKKGKIWRNKF